MGGKRTLGPLIKWQYATASDIRHEFTLSKASFGRAASSYFAFQVFDRSPLAGGGDAAKLSGVRALPSSPTSQEAELGMAAMSEKYREAGDLYVPAEPAK